ncbi:putative protein C4orf19 like [Dissostichus eleginoides]|uniref:Uncharacterized protein n=1 Tax=Dissostichus eleginoides TaxID=100907 RepID=A0AAD9BVV6_DISEL|nr:putative protein C4orf19 like [Dissostichus eleginoides]
MGCQCCRMIKSYMYDPSVAVDVRKTDSASSSLYQPHQLPRCDPLQKQKQGFNNLGYSKSNDSTLKLEVDNNHVNHRLHSVPNEPHRQATDGGLYIIQPEALGPDCVIGSESLSADEIDEGVGGTPEYLCDTGDEGSVLSVDLQTSTTSLSSVDTRDGLRLPKALDVSTVESGISVMKSEDEEEEEGEVHSVMDSMVAEALAALEAATAGEEYE